MQVIHFPKKDVRISIYKGFPLSCGICYSPSMKEQKEKSQGKKKAKELEDLEKKLKPFKKRSFACEEDARLEI